MTRYFRLHKFAILFNVYVPQHLARWKSDTNSTHYLFLVLCDSEHFQCNNDISSAVILHHFAHNYNHNMCSIKYKKWGNAECQKHVICRIVSAEKRVELDALCRTKFCEKCYALHCRLSMAVMAAPPLHLQRHLKLPICRPQILDPARSTKIAGYLAGSGSGS